jgi:hypothetical protein
MIRPVPPEFDRRQWFPLPKQYELADTSGITTTIHSGDNTFDIDLKRHPLIRSSRNRTLFSPASNPAFALILAAVRPAQPADTGAL